MLEKDKEPLVSIIVITYNSAKYVLDTLESAKAQTYKNIELIISDDCSTDNTVEICKKWLNENKDRFVSSKLVTTNANTGIPANINRGLHAAKGEWFKTIAGDDILHKECIFLYVNFVLSNPEVKVVTANCQVFINTFSKENFTEIKNFSEFYGYKSNITAQDQHKIFLRRCPVNSCTMFYNAKVIMDNNGCDERFRWFEDHPLYLKLTKNGTKIFYLNKVTVYYRLHNSSVYSSVNSKQIFNDFYLKSRKFELEYLYPEISFSERIYKDLTFFKLRFFDIMGMNKNKFLFNFLYFGINKLNPFKFFRNKLSRKKIKNNK
ncbi:MAG: hypothetical protein COA67_11205 [Lutibacter sp.]|nr:MAG: hypothetical protein COA67_11205 [Lutibacter sp.]